MTKRKARGHRPRAYSLKNSSLVAPTVTSMGPALVSAAETAASPLFSRAGFIDGQIAAINQSSVQSINRFLRLFGRTHCDEGKAAGTASGAIHHEVCLSDSSVRREGVLEIVFGGVEREVPNE